MRKWTLTRSLSKCSLYLLPCIILLFLASEIRNTYYMAVLLNPDDPQCPGCAKTRQLGGVPPALVPANNNGSYESEHQGHKDDVALVSERTVTEKDISHVVEMPYFVDSKDPGGPGEGGAPVRTKPDSEHKALYDVGWKNHNFNEFVSTLISVHRSLPDCRSEVCLETIKNFTGKFPEISIIIIFNNEAWTTLLRSVHSILNRTPEERLREIILVDDKSDFDHLQAPLEKYFSSFPKVKIIRAPERVGLTRARLLGFDVSTAPVVVFLDSHIECFPGWSDSLLMRIAENPQAVAFPSIETISDKNFGVTCTKKFSYYCAFQLSGLLFRWEEIPQREKDRRKNEAESYRAPTMPGGLFAIHRDFFKKVGTYDPGLDFWGGENIELSFKAWMCGGTLEMDPCSHISHVFRSGTPIKGSHETVLKNSWRVAEVWMDDYKNYFYERMNYQEVDYGNVTSRKNLRENLQCHSFEWYIQNIFPECRLPRNMTYAGEIRSLAASKCLDSAGGKGTGPITFHCHKKGENQVWYKDQLGQMQQDNIFICVENGNLLFKSNECQPGGGHWEYRENKTIVHVPTNLCLTASESDDKVSVAPCNDTIWQQWEAQRRRSDLVFPM